MMRIGNTVFLWFRVPRQPKVTKTLSYRDVFNKLSGINRTAHVEVTDGSYISCSKAEFERVLGQSNFYAMKRWQKRIFDCENFACSLRSLLNNILKNYAFGEVHVEYEDGGKHALNFFIDKDQRFWYVEPQNNAVYQVDILKQRPYFFLI